MPAPASCSPWACDGSEGCTIVAMALTNDDLDSLERMLSVCGPDSTANTGDIPTADLDRWLGGLDGTFEMASVALLVAEVRRLRQPHEDAVRFLREKAIGLAEDVHGMLCDSYVTSDQERTKVDADRAELIEEIHAAADVLSPRAPTP